MPQSMTQAVGSKCAPRPCGSICLCSGEFGEPPFQTKKEGVVGCHLLDLAGFSGEMKGNLSCLGETGLRIFPKGNGSQQVLLCHLIWNLNEYHPKRRFLKALGSIIRSGKQPTSWQNSCTFYKNSKSKGNTKINRVIGNSPFDMVVNRVICISPY